MEMEAVADIFDRDRDGFIDYKQFVATLKPDRSEVSKPKSEGERIQEEIKRQADQCTCPKQFHIHKIGEGKYSFGESQKLRLVRILRSTVMVRVGGGWEALNEFLQKNDPCRAKGRTNMELREHFVMPAGASQTMTHFRSKPRAQPGSGVAQAESGSSYSGYSSNSSGPITKIHEKTVHSTPWRQSPRSRVSPDAEVTQILKAKSPSLGKLSKPQTPSRDHGASPSSTASHTTNSRPNSRPSSRASSRPSSVADSDVSGSSEHMMAADGAGKQTSTSVRTETRTLGGRPTTTVTYQTHTSQTRTIPVQSSASAKAAAAATSTPRGASKISTPTSSLSSGRKTPTAQSTSSNPTTPTAIRKKISTTKDPAAKN